MENFSIDKLKMELERTQSLEEKKAELLKRVRDKKKEKELRAKVKTKQYSC